MAKRENRQEQEKYKYRIIGLAAVLFLLIVTAAVVTTCISRVRINNEKNSILQTDREGKEQLCIYQDWSDAVFVAEPGGKKGALSMSAPSVLIYWASWCPHCRDGMAQIEGLYEDAKRAGINFYLVNKLDGIKETAESAEKYLTDNGINIPAVYDDGARIYDNKGLRMIPTAVVIDGQGRVASFLEGELPDGKRLKSMMAEAESGKGKYLEKSILNNLLTTEYGIRTNYLEGSKEVPSGEDELSESMGLMLLYAADTENKELYERLQNRLWQNGIFVGEGILFPWVVTSKQDITVNAAVDDFRIYRAQKTAENLWGENKDFEDYAGTLYECLVKKGRLSDFYDFSSCLASDTFTLCYADFPALLLMAEEYKQWEIVYEDTLKRVKQGKISESFPLYYSRYDYQNGRYIGTDLNMAEALVTFLHLAQAGELPEDSYSWLKNRLEEGVVYAGYGADNRPLADRRYESTAVYALSALIAMEKGDMHTAGLAFNLMEPFRIRNGDSELDGLFGEEDGSGIYSFDQCVALEAYQKMEKLIGK